MKDYQWHVGVAQKQNPWLQIPLDVRYHVGNFGIDSGVGVLTWEGTFGTQMEHLEWVNDQVDYDIWEQAKVWAIQNSASIGIIPLSTKESNSTPSGNANDTKN